MIPTPTRTNRQPSNALSPSDLRSLTSSNTSSPIERRQHGQDPNWWKVVIDTANTLFKLVKDNYHLGNLGGSLPEVQEITNHLVKTLQLLPVTTQYTQPEPHRIEHRDARQTSDEIKEMSSRLRSQEVIFRSIHDSLNKLPRWSEQVVSLQIISSAVIHHSGHALPQSSPSLVGA